jgi:hypothetical protein
MRPGIKRWQRQGEFDVAAYKAGAMKRRIAEAILFSFRDDALPEATRTLASATPRKWERGLRFLDESGLALYFLARLKAAERTSALSENVFSRLSHDFADNRAQTAELITEFAGIISAFQPLRLRYATLKGFSLLPDYCPDPALRCQFDFDFLIDRSAASSFADALRELGYQRVHAGESAWEFKKGTARVPSVRELYKPKPQRAIELHLQSAASEEGSIGDPLSRVEERCISDIHFPALSSADAFVYQSVHIFKHIGSEWTRVSWLLEFRNFVRAHCEDESLWIEVHSRAREKRECAMAIGAATLLATMAFGEFAPQILKDWTVRTLPLPVRLWIERYGWSILLAGFPGTKLYLLLQRELVNEEEWRRLRRSRLLPFHRAPKVIQQLSGGQKLVDFNQLHFSALRMRFHLVEGFRYLIEAGQWKRVRAGEISGRERPHVGRTVEGSVATRS